MTTDPLAHLTPDDHAAAQAKADASGHPSALAPFRPGEPWCAGCGTQDRPLRVTSAGSWCDGCQPAPTFRDAASWALGLASSGLSGVASWLVRRQSTRQARRRGRSAS